MLRNHLRCKNDCGGNHVVFCPEYNSVLQARNCALELRLLGHFISRLFCCWRDTYCSLWTRNVILPTQAANRFFFPFFSYFLLPKRNVPGSWVLKVYFFSFCFVFFRKIESRWESRNHRLESLRDQIIWVFKVLGSFPASNSVS